MTSKNRLIKKRAHLLEPIKKTPNFKIHCQQIDITIMGKFVVKGLSLATAAGTMREKVGKIIQLVQPNVKLTKGLGAIFFYLHFLFFVELFLCV
jgi:hypothetical protein